MLKETQEHHEREIDQMQSMYCPLIVRMTYTIHYLITPVPISKLIFSTVSRLFVPEEGAGPLQEGVR